MKKIFTLTLICALALTLLVGCKGGEVEKSELETFFSDNGYCVEYPQKYTVSHLGAEIDFVIMDEETGSNVTILRTEKVYGLETLTEREFISQMDDEGYDDIVLSSFDTEEINGTPCIVAEFEFGETKITKIIYDASDNTYTATLTLLPGTLESVKAELLTVIRSVMV